MPSKYSSIQTKIHLFLFLYQLNLTKSIIYLNLDPHTLLQLILTIDFAFYINEYLGERHEDTGGKCFLCIQFSTMAICYGLTLAMAVLLFVFYTAPDDCDTNKVRSIAFSAFESQPWRTSIGHGSFTLRLQHCPSWNKGH